MSTFSRSLLFLACLTFLFGCDNRKVEYKKADQKDVALVLHLNEDSIKVHGNKLTLLGTKQTKYGVSGHARMLNGSDEYLLYNKSLAYPTQTISFWVKPLVTPDMRSAKAGLMGLQDQPAGNASWRWLINRNYDRTVSFVIYDPKQSKAQIRLKSKSRIEDGVWNHVGVTIDTVDKGLVTLYINGKKQLEKRIYSNQPMGNLYIGTNKEKGYFKGEVDEVVVLTKSLDAADVAKLASKKSSPYFAFLIDPAFPGTRTVWKKTGKKPAKRKKAAARKAPAKKAPARPAVRKPATR